MVKKSPVKSELKGFLMEIFEDVLLSAASALKGKPSTIMRWAKELTGINQKIDKKVRYIIIITSGIILLSMGGSTYISSLIPQLQNGVSQIIIGALLVAAAITYKHKG